jgi:hypothetical protein
VAQVAGEFGGGFFGARAKSVKRSGGIEDADSRMREIALEDCGFDDGLLGGRSAARSGISKKQMRFDEGRKLGGLIDGNGQSS